MLKKIGAVVVSVAPLAAFAAVDTDVSTSLTTAAVDVAAVAALAFLVYLAPKAFKYMRGGL